MNETKIITHLSAAVLASTTSGFAMDAKDLTAQALYELQRLGITFDERNIAKMMAAMDANVLTPTIGSPTIAPLAQFLQNWLPGLVRTITQARKIDRLVGISIGGSWEDEEVIQGILEPTGLAVPYGDYTNVPLASWNISYERRGVVRFENGIRVGVLEEARASRINVNSATEKRNAAQISLEILRNRVGFYGYNGGTNRVFGILNDPGLPSYVTVPNGAGGSPLWSLKTFGEITADIRSAVAALITASGDTINPRDVDTILAVATNASQFLAVTTDFGVSVEDWIKKTYPKMRIETAPEFNAANGGANVFYLYAPKVDDGSSDGGNVFDQIVPAKTKTLGVEQQAKAYIEDYTNALAGVMLKRPWAVVRRSGI